MQGSDNLKRMALIRAEILEEHQFKIKLMDNNQQEI